MNIKPTHNRVLIKAEPIQYDLLETLKVYRPNDENNTARLGEVLAVADEVYDINVGDRVMFDHFGTRIDNEHGECYMVHEQYVMMGVE